MFDPKTKELLRILSDGNLHSGASLGQALGVTRSAIWKLIQQLRKTTGLKIEAKTNQGYCLEGQLELLDIHQISAYLSKRYHPYLEKTVILDKVTSTNTYLLEQAKTANNEICICLAEMQTAGRGRFNRRWLSPFSGNIYLSLLRRFQIDLTQLSGLSLMVAICVGRALKKYGIQQKISVKWPNDVYLDNCKLAGNLIELRGEFHHYCEAVIGVGLNLHMSEELRSSTNFSLTDLSELAEQPIKRNQIVALLLEELLDSLAVFEAEGLKPFIAEFKKLDYTFNQPVKMVHNEKILYGMGRGIDEKGCFILEDNEGQTQRFLCGEASLKLQDA